MGLFQEIADQRLRTNISRARQAQSKRKVIIEDTDFSFETDELFNNLPLGQDSQAVFCSTLVEGIGNFGSDVDLYVLCDRYSKVTELPRSFREYYWVEYVDGNGVPLASIAIDSANYPRTSYVKMLCWHDPANGIKVDAEFIEFREVLGLIKKLDDYFQMACETTVESGFDFPTRDILFLHRFSSGIPLNSINRYEELFRKIDIEKLCFVLHRNVLQGFHPIKDIIGNFREEKYELAAFLSHRYLSQEALAFSHLLGNSNVRIKWLLPFIEQYSGEHSSLFARYKSLLFRNGSQSHQEYVLEAFDYIDKLYAASRTIYDNSNSIPSTQHFRTLILDEISTYDSLDREVLWELGNRIRRYSPEAWSGRDLLQCDENEITKDWLLQLLRT